MCFLYLIRQPEHVSCNKIANSTSKHNNGWNNNYMHIKVKKEKVTYINKWNCFEQMRFEECMNTACCQI